MTPGPAEAFVRKTPFGVLAGFHVGDARDADVPSGLHAEEQTHAAALSSRKRAEWIAGRLAFWRAAAELGVPRAALLNGERGEPLIPDGLAGSISHKPALAIALVARTDSAGASLGVDLEEQAPPRPSIEDIALRPEERNALRELPEPARWPRLVLAFAAKEALYKALHPHLKRYVRYDEASILFSPDGVPSIRLHLDSSAAFDTELRIETAPAGHVLAAVRVTPRT